jgi:hypothetical protein
VHSYVSELEALSAKLDFNGSLAVEKQDSVRSILLDYWKASPEGNVFMTAHAGLAGIKEKTEQQKAAFEQSTKSLNMVNTMLQRAVDTYRGVSALRKQGFAVTIAKVQNSNTFACYVKRGDEFELVRFNAAQLRNVSGAKIEAKTSTADVRESLSTAKSGAANDKKGGSGERFSPSELPNAVTRIDTSVAAIIKPDGKGIAAGPKATEALHLLWARLDAMMSDSDKAAARKAFAAEGVKAKAEDAKAEASIKRALRGGAKRKTA